MNYPKNITRRRNALRARISCDGVHYSKDFPFTEDSKEEILQQALDWLEEKKKALPLGKNTSKYKQKEIINLTQEKLKEFLDYNPETGDFIWKKASGNPVKIGNSAGTYDDKGYRIIVIFGKAYKAHRLAFLYMNGQLPHDKIVIDHINRNTSDNRWVNLRLATRGENVRNSITAKSIVGIKGITILRGKYRASITHNKRFYSKYFPKTEEGLQEAISYIRNLREKFHGEFANHG